MVAILLVVAVITVMLIMIVLGLMSSVALATLASPIAAWYVLFYTSDYDNAIAMWSPSKEGEIMPIMVSLLLIFVVMLVGIRMGHFLAFSLCYSMICVFTYTFGESLVKDNFLLGIVLLIVTLIISFVVQQLISIRIRNSRDDVSAMVNVVNESRDLHIFSTLTGTLIMYLNMMAFVYPTCLEAAQFQTMSAVSVVRAAAIIAGCMTAIISLFYHTLSKWMG